jgi:hypothetical protein
LPITGDTIGVEWASLRDEVRISSGGTSTDPLHNITFDLVKHTSSINVPLLDTISGVQINDVLPNTPIYGSPSGRYLAYLNKSDSSFTIHDTKTNTTTKTKLQFSAESENSLVQVVWSENETAVWLKRSDSLVEFLFIEDGVIYPISLVKFKSDTNDDVYTDNVYARPSEQKYALILGRILNHSTSETWLVNLTTMIGKSIQVENIYDIAFSPSGKSIYVITKDGFGRLNPDLKTVTYIPSLLSNQWGVYAASLSPTLNYALLTVGSTESQSYWIYKLPALQ